MRSGRSTLVRLVEGRHVAFSGAGRQIRRIAGLSLSELAAVIGVDKSTLSRWERGLERPRTDAAIRYEEALRKMLRAIEGDAHV